jgi:hypothetical protein
MRCCASGGEFVMETSDVHEVELLRSSQATATVAATLTLGRGSSRRKRGGWTNEDRKCRRNEPR